MPYLTEQPIQQSEFFSEPNDPSAGALGVFFGIVRNHHGSRAVEELFYESYRPMAEMQMGEVIRRAQEQWKLRKVRVCHRVGRLLPGETAVAVCVWSDHRAEAFAASRFIIDEIKKTVPIWKLETYADGKKEWVRCHEKN